MYSIKNKSQTNFFLHTPYVKRSWMNKFSNFKTQSLAPNIDFYRKFVTLVKNMKWNEEINCKLLWIRRTRKQTKSLPGKLANLEIHTHILSWSSWNASMIATVIYTLHPCLSLFLSWTNRTTSLNFEIKQIHHEISWNI